MPRLCSDPKCPGWFHITSAIRKPESGEHFYHPKTMKIYHAEGKFNEDEKYPIAIRLNRPSPENPE